MRVDIHSLWTDRVSGRRSEPAEPDTPRNPLPVPPEPRDPREDWWLHLIIEPMFLLGCIVLAWAIILR